MMKRGTQQREKKFLSTAGLIKIVRKNFEKIPIKRSNTRGNDRKISLADSLSSALAMFSLKSPSLLAFDQARKNPNISHNLKTLYGVEQAPSDTYMREELDRALWEAMRRYCFICKIDSWSDLFTAITQAIGFALKLDST